MLHERPGTDYELKGEIQLFISNSKIGRRLAAPSMVAKQVQLIKLMSAMDNMAEEEA